MRIACLAAGLLAAAFLIHLLWWRIRLPQRQTAMLLIVFLSVLVLGLAAGELLSVLGATQPLPFWACVQIAIFHIAMTLAYVVAYSVIEGNSPTMVIVTAVADSQGRGLTRAELDQALRATVTVEVRIAAMVHNRMATEQRGIYRLTGKGRAWAAVFTFWQGLLKLDKGG